MWLLKWFSGRRDARDDDEPARHSAPAATKHGAPDRRSSAHADRNSPTRARKDQANGFDPYNSGAFETRNAWERTNRR